MSEAANGSKVPADDCGLDVPEGAPVRPVVRFDVPEAADSADSQRIRAVTTLLRGWVWETDAEHRFTYMSDSVATFAGRAPEWHYGKTRHDLGNTNTTPEEQALQQAQLDRREPFGPFDLSREQDGQRIWMRTLGLPHQDSNGAFRGYSGIAFDVTAELEARERELAAQERLRGNLDLLAATVRHFPGAISVFDCEQRLVLANPLYHSMLNIPEGLFPLGSHCEDILRHCCNSGVFPSAVHAEVLSSHQRIRGSSELQRFERALGDGRRIEVRGAMLPDGGFIKSYTDITERVERRLLAATERAKSEFMAALSDEIQDHLRQTLGILRHLSGNGLTAEQGQLVSAVRESAKALLSNIDMINAIASLNVPVTHDKDRRKDRAASP